MPPAPTASAASITAARSLQTGHDPTAPGHALWAALAQVVVWGANFTVHKAIFRVLSPSGFLFARSLIVLRAATALLCVRHGLAWPRVTRADAFALRSAGRPGPARSAPSSAVPLSAGSSGAGSMQCAASSARRR
jgi:hypothetical protein